MSERDIRRDIDFKNRRCFYAKSMHVKLKLNLFLTYVVSLVVWSGGIIANFTFSFLILLILAVLSSLLPFLLLSHPLPSLLLATLKLKI